MIFQSIFNVNRDILNSRDSKGNKPGTTTISEAQLIGRGARYFPFVVGDNDDRFRRKFDKDAENELRVLEQLHYHSINDSRYISEIRKALVEKGMLDEDIVQKRLILKDKFRKTAFFKTGSIYINKKVPSSYNNVKCFGDLGVKKTNFKYKISSGKGSADMLLEEQTEDKKNGSFSEKDVSLKDIPRHIIQNAVSKREFFSFKNLSRYFRDIESIDEFITSKNYLAGLGMTFSYSSKNIELSNLLYLQALNNLLEKIENEIKSNTTEYQGTKKFDACDIKVIFDTDKDGKVLNINKNDVRADGDVEFVKGKDWYAFNANYGTSEEKAFVRMLAGQIEELEKKHENIFLIRNERHFKIFNFSDGRAFEPDFVLFLKKKDGEFSTYQLFIEPKGKHIKTSETEKWKEKFLQEIKEEFKGKLLTFNAKDKYRITGVPFYNNEDENQFKESLYAALED